MDERLGHEILDRSTLLNPVSQADKVTGAAKTLARQRNKK